MKKSIIFFILVLIAVFLVDCQNPFEPEEKIVTETETKTVTNTVYVEPTVTNVVVYTNEVNHAESVQFTVQSYMYGGTFFSNSHPFSAQGREADGLQWVSGHWEPAPLYPDVNIFCEDYVVVVNDPSSNFLGILLKVYVRWTTYEYVIVTNYE